MNKDVYNIAETKEILFPFFESEPVFSAVLFGSYANDEATEHSDVDIVIDIYGQQSWVAR